MAICVRCGAFVPYARKKLGFDKCMECNAKYAQERGEWMQSMVIPSNKSTPTYISDPELLKQLNPKRTM